MRDAPGVIGGILLAGLAMSVGWGIRGDYGHEAGAAIPGALLGLAVCLASGREDWWRRASILGLCGAIGWAFGGQMSYGRIIGYTASSSLPDVLYGYACLFVIGGLWAGIGSAILALGVTQPMSFLERFARPLVVLGFVWLVLALTGLTDRLAGRWSLNDTDWVGASSALLVACICALLFPADRKACGFIAVLAVGWWAGYLILTVLLGLHMTPPRSDNWAGCVGLFVALLLHVRRRRDRVAVTAAAWGVLIGGVGFVLGDFANMLGRAQWGPIGRYEVLHGLDSWKWMEQSFGLIMGLGVGAVFLTQIRPKAPRLDDDVPSRRLRAVALVLLLPVMMGLNLSKNVTAWVQKGHIPRDLLGIGSTWWCLAIGLLLSACAIVAIARLSMTPARDLGRARGLFLFLLWVAVVGAFTQALPAMDSPGVFLVHMSFWITAGVCALLALAGKDQPPGEPVSAGTWRQGWGFWTLACLVPVLVFAVAWMTVASHEGPLPGSHLRFSAPSEPPAP